MLAVWLPWDKLFFSEDFSHPLDEKEAGIYHEVLEMVRLAPSAVNTQPWRIIKDDRGFHFFGEETRYYRIKRVDFLRNNDIGIAMSHFDLTCRELNLQGKWEQLDIANSQDNLTYITSWITNN